MIDFILNMRYVFLALSVLSIIVPAFYYKEASFDLKRVAWLLVVMSLFQIMSVTTSLMEEVNNWIFHAYVIPEFVLFMFIFYLWEPAYKKEYRTAMYIIPFILMVHLVPVDFNGIPITALTIQCAVLFLISVRMVFLNETKYRFIISLSALLYFSHNTMAYIFYGVSDIAYLLLWHVIIDFISSIAYLVGFIYGTKYEPSVHTN